LGDNVYLGGIATVDVADAEDIVGSRKGPCGGISGIVARPVLPQHVRLIGEMDARQGQDSRYCIVGVPEGLGGYTRCVIKIKAASCAVGVGAVAQQ